MSGLSTAISFTISESETMVEILCPHCEEEVELDDDASGTYTCPHCDGEFEWGIEEIQMIHYEPDKSKSEKPWFIIATQRSSDSRIRMLVPGFEPGSKPREGFMMGHYTIRATSHRLVTCIYSERVLLVYTFTRSESEKRLCMLRFIPLKHLHFQPTLSFFS